MSKVSSYLRALDIDPQMNSFSQRKRLQKIGYLLEEWGFDLPYRFTWYIHGPYSPGLTQMLYDISSTKNAEAEELTKDELDRLNEFKDFLRDDLIDSDKLELLASVHFLRKKANETGASKDDVILVLNDKKPYFTQNDIDYAWRKSIELDKLVQQ